MKLTLNISMDEAISMVQKYLNLPDTTVVTIAGFSYPANCDSDKASGKLDLSLSNMLTTIDGLNWNGNEKIRCIKYFRECIPCNLIDAKWAIENWRFVSDWIRTWKRDPKFFGVYPNISIH
jgi:ribosomal protein L7/L12